MAVNIEDDVYDLVRPYAGKYIFNIKKVTLTPETDLDSDLNIDDLEAEHLMNEFFKRFNVTRDNFKIETYYPPESLTFSWNPFKKTLPILVPDFTIGMLIKSAKAGRWLYD